MLTLVSWVLIVNIQIGSLILNLSCVHILTSRFPNGKCEPTFNFFISKPFLWCKNCHFEQCLHAYALLFQIFRTLQDSNSQSDSHLKVLGIHLYIFSHLWERVWVLICFFNLHHFSTQFWLQAHHWSCSNLCFLKQLCLPYVKIKLFSLILCFSWSWYHA
jgi:hypothetical protein